MPYCSVPGCYERGTGKPWCLRHIDKAPEASKIRAELARQRREATRISRVGSDGIDIDGEVVKDLCMMIAELGEERIPLSIAARNLRISVRLLPAYFEAIGWRIVDEYGLITAQAP